MHRISGRIVEYQLYKQTALVGSGVSETDRLISHPSPVPVISNPQKRMIYVRATNDRKMAALAPIQKMLIDCFGDELTSEPA